MTWIGNLLRQNWLYKTSDTGLYGPARSITIGHVPVRSLGKATFPRSNHSYSPHHCSCSMGDSNGGEHHCSSLPGAAVDPFLPADWSSRHQENTRVHPAQVHVENCLRGWPGLHTCLPPSYFPSPHPAHAFIWMCASAASDSRVNYHHCGGQQISKDAHFIPLP